MMFVSTTVARCSGGAFASTRTLLCAMKKSAPGGGQQPRPSPPRVRSSEPLPTKDRFPPVGFNASDHRTRTAVLIDASAVTPEQYALLVPKIQNNDSRTLLLQRVFSTDPMPPLWADAIKAQQQPTAAAGLVGVGMFERFKVESFMPVHIQMMADARHIAELRRDNRMQGIAVVCGTAEHKQYAAVAERLKGTKIMYVVVDPSGEVTSCEC
eukprot:PhM_4_TR3675/c0_g3_i1/m.20154